MQCPACGQKNRESRKFCAECGDPPLTRPEPAKPTSASPPLPASIAAGRYEVKRFLGEGAKKRVYLAHDTKLDRDVAVAVLKTEGIDETSLDRIRLEARAMARLGDHPGIVTVHDIGEEDGRPYIVSQYVAGGTVEDLLERSPAKRISVEQALQIAEDVCHALEHAHSHAIVHRDLKPANVWLSKDGVAKLGDFGLAVSPDRSKLTGEGSMLGTVAYMSPEQALGKIVDGRSDLYSLGALLYELVAGQAPFVGADAVAIIAQHLNAEPRPPSRFNPEVPPILDALILCLLAKTPADRPASAENVVKLLKGISIEREGKRSTGEAAGSRPDSLPDGVFVGRKEEFERLSGGVEEAFGGRGRLFVLVGEPGIGKTRTAEQLATYARLKGAQVLVGRCHEGEGAPAYWPWTQVIRSYLASEHPAKVEAEMGMGAADIAQVFSDVVQILPDLPPLPSSMEAEQGRFRLFDAITTFLKNAAKAKPLVLILDDLHWADRSSLLLLQFLAHEIESSRLLVIGTYRDVEVQRGHPLVEVMASLRRERVYARVLLRGLAESEVRALLAALGGQEVPEAFAREIYRETEGNPFFIGEILRYLVEEKIIYREGGRWVSKVRPDDMGLPESVRDVIGRRLNRLAKECNDILAIASVIGRDFELRALATVSEVARDTLEKLIEEAVRARVLAKSPGAGSRYSFSHALIRETLYEELPTSRRLRLHGSIGRALEDAYGGDLEGHLSELSYHFSQALEIGGDVDKALDYAQRAAENARRRLAYEEAIGHYEQALQALERKQPGDESRRCELLLALSDTSWNGAQFDKAKEVSRQAAGLAGGLRRPDLLARAALGFGSSFVLINFSRTDEELIGMLKQALDLFPAGDSTIRARLSARLVQALFWIERPEQQAFRAREAIEMARRLGDPLTMAHVVMGALNFLLAPDSLDERSVIDAELRRVAEQCGDPSIERTAEVVRLAFLSERTAVPERIRRLEILRSLAENEPRPRWWVRILRVCQAAFAYIEGRLGDSERFATEALEIGQAIQQPDASLIFGAQMFRLRREQGRAAEFEAIYKASAERLPHFVAFRAALTLIHAEEGRLGQAGLEFEDLARAGFSSLRRDFWWLPNLWFLTEICATLEDEMRALKLYELLNPYAEHVVTNGGIVSQGTVSRLLGVLATTLHRWEEATRHFEHAVETHRRLGHRLWLAWSQYNYARMLLTRDSGDREKASLLLSDALSFAQERGLKLLLDRSLALKMKAEGTATTDVKTSIEAVTASVETKHPDLRRHAAPDGTVTIMFSDIEGFSTMTERLGDREAHKVIQAHNQIVRGQLKAHGGYEVELQGDGFLLAFPSASGALQCAVAIQRAFAAYNTDHADQPIRIRTGLHTGEPIKDADRFFGKTVILASRIASEAHGGEIFVSSLVKELASGVGDFAFDAGQETELKGLEGTHRVYELLWDGREPRRKSSASRAVTALSGNIFVREGDYWTIAHGGKSVRLRDMKGLHCIARLLRHPGQEFHVADLATAGEPGGAGPIGDEQPVNVTAGLGHAGEILDPQARAQYKDRLESLRAELEEAKSFNDTGRVQTLQEEIDFLSEELSAAFGLGGRAKKAADSTERMRKTVTNRIRESLARIHKEHPELGVHFSNAIRTGTFCSYNPEKPTNWQL